MADVELVIKIPENVYYDTFQYVESLASSDFELLMMRAVKNGTPLPKGHGRLIDADRLKEEMEKDVRKAMSFVDLTDFVWLAPTIVKVDKESEGQ